MAIKLIGRTGSTKAGHADKSTAGAKPALFAGMYDHIKGFYFAAQGPEAQTLGDLFGVPTWLVLAALVLLAIAGFSLGTWFERRRGGALSAQELDGEQPMSATDHIETISVHVS